MAQLSTKRTEVEAGPRRVWSVITDPTRMPEWLPGVDRVESTQPLGIGSSLHLGVGPVDRTAAVVEFDEPTCFAFRIVNRGIATVYRYEIDADGTNGSVVTVTIDVRPASVWGWFVTPLARRAIRQADRDHGERIRTAVLDAPW